MELIDVVNGHNFWIGIPIIFSIIGIIISSFMILWIIKCKPRTRAERSFIVKNLIIGLVFVGCALCLFNAYTTFPIYRVIISDKVSYNAIAETYKIIGKSDDYWELRSYTNTYIPIIEDIEEEQIDRAIIDRDR